MSSSNQQFNFNNIHDFLFETTNKMNSDTYNYNFARIWNEIDGEYNMVSEFVEACKLIVESNRSALAAAIALGEPSESPQNDFSALIGDVTPAAAAVLGESPIIDTPYLDPCISTPFTPSSAFTPSLTDFQNSPYIATSVYNNCAFSNPDLQDDVQVAKYLKNDSSWHDVSNAATPAMSVQPYSGDISLLAIEQTPTCKDEDFDSLFPPLSSDNCNNVYSDSSNNEVNMFPQSDMDAVITFDNDFLMDDYFVDDNTHPPIPSNNVITTPLVTQTTNNKRKLQDSTINTYEPKPTKRRANKQSAIQNTQNHECLLCGMHFTRRYNLSSHMKTHNPNRLKPFPCNICNKQFDRKHDLARHVSTVHNGERAFNCSQCNCTFSRKDALNRHAAKKHVVSMA